MKETTEIMCNVIDVQYQLCLAKDQQNMASTPVFDSISTEVSRFETVRSLILKIYYRFLYFLLEVTFFLWVSRLFFY
jgi:hypothetical protein